MAKAELVIENVEDASVQPIPSRSRLLIILAFSAVVLLEMILLLWFLPKSPPAPAPPGGSQDTPPRFQVDEPVRVPPGEWVSKPISEPFMTMVTSEDGTTGYMVSAQFTLKCEKNKEKRYTNLYDQVKDDIRGEIQVILRSSKIQDITDPNNTVIKNRILQKVNEIFNEPQPLVKEVIILSFHATPL